MNKGVSPLIAYVLLIAMAISLSVMFATWSKKTTEDITDSIVSNQEKQDKCNSVAFGFNITSGKCYDEGRDFMLKTSVTNRGNANIVKFNVILNGEEIDITNPNIRDGMDVSVGETKDLNIGQTDSVDEIELIPFVDIKGKQIGCFERRVKVKC